MGMPNAYKVANEMINDKMRESDRYDDFMKIKDADVVIVSGCYDHIQNVFKAADMKYGLTPPLGLDKVQINPEQTIFINCPGKLPILELEKSHILLMKVDFYLLQIGLWQMLLRRHFQDILDTIINQHVMKL